MDFAKRQLEKYGWKEGQGLGKKEDGISTALKPKLKFNTTGVGHNAGQEFTDNWWASVYQSALTNIEVNNEDGDDVKMSVKSEDSVDVSTKGYLKALKKQNISLEYGSFIKTAKLTQNGTVNYDIPSIGESSEQSRGQILTDEEIFAACGGRTAHKAARHGLKLSGKLSRLEKQEKMLLKKLQNVSLYDEKYDIEKKMKRIAKHKDKQKSNKEDVFGILNFEDDSHSSSSSTSRKYKKKKKRKSVSFNETVTEYHTQDLDSSVHSSDSNEASVVLTIIEKSQIKDEDELNDNPNPDCSTFDEGIEQDLESGKSEDCNHKSFEQAQSSTTERLSKAERKLIKKNRATYRFLQEMNESSTKENSLEETEEECKKCIKRKQEDDYSHVLLSAKRICEVTISNGAAQYSKSKKKKNKKGKNRRKREEKKINLIAKSLNDVCKISDNSK